jgi:predicted lactoylglutathione lyase
LSRWQAFVHVADVQRSIGFYGKLGFRVRDTCQHDGELDWAAF